MNGLSERLTESDKIEIVEYKKLRSPVIGLLFVLAIFM